MTQQNRFSLNTILYGSNISYITSLYKQYQKDPTSASQEWQEFFKDFSAESLLEEMPDWSKSLSKKVQLTASPSTYQEINDSIKTSKLIQAYRTWGHRASMLDPLGFTTPPSHAELDPTWYGFDVADLQKSIYVNDLGFENTALKDVIQKLHKIYCGKIGIEFMHLENTLERKWIQDRFEDSNQHYTSHQYSPHHEKTIFQNLLKAEAFEKFLHVKFPGAKRFGLDGNESLIPALETILEKSTENGGQEIVLGMSHRGRLAVMATFLNKPMRFIFALFQGTSIYTEEEGSGDVKYHQGYSSDRIVNDHKVHLSLTPNPSHLESVYPVVLGKVRGKQTAFKASEKKNILGVILHGDAAFTGQGVVAESLQLAKLEGYDTGGTIHIIVNNQIGFTTNSTEARSSYYSSETAKIIQAPILHVNADSPHAVVWAAELASDFRNQFGKDIVIDLIGYRRYGHNEGDEPTFTQPTMYQIIASHPSVSTLFEQNLLQSGIVQENELKEIHNEIEQHLQLEYEASTDLQNSDEGKLKPDWLKGDWEGIKARFEKIEESIQEITTGVHISLLTELGQAALTVPANFNLHSKIDRQFKQRQSLFEIDSEQHRVDWATAESLAFATLLHQGYPVRLSGQDSGRGTFSQRHAILIDQSTQETYVPLNHLPNQKASFEIINSPLSEMAVMGFDYGYSLSNPNTLVIWEAQFGDFSNGAQIIIDQYLSASKSKWLRLSGLVLLLPHGLEGMGPEHSSARLERYLQLCAENNLQVVNCSTPANYFHVLRRQLHSPNRSPLIVMTPKSLLRHRLAVSDLNDMGENTHFKKILHDTISKPEEIKRVVLCSGKVYYDLLQYRQENSKDNVALIRIEQLYPFPAKELENALHHYKNAEIIWCQEEPKNMGAWTFIDRRLENVLTKIQAYHSRSVYVGRDEAASPATGSPNRHIEEQNTIVRAAISEVM
jgi:2-oxoglutarate dehydrogenase E1 component